MCHQAKFSQNRKKWFSRYSNFMILKDTEVRRHVFSNFQIFSCLSGWEG